MTGLGGAELGERLSTRLLQLLSISSVTGDEREIADHVERWAEAILPNINRLRFGNSVVVGKPDGSRPCVALVGHLDTVPPPLPRGEKSSAKTGPGEFTPPRREGDRITGLGASDMKGSLAVVQLLMEELDIDNLPFAIVAIFYDREEGPYDENGLEPLLSEVAWLSDIDLALVMEPTDQTLQLGCMGSIQARVCFKGRAAHSARPWQGCNAIHAAGRFLQALDDLPQRDVLIDGLIFSEVTSATLASGGAARNIVPERFTLNVNYRFAPRGGIQETIANAKQQLLDLVNSCLPAVTDSGGDAATVSVEFHDVSPAAPVPQDSPLLTHLRRVAQLPEKPKQAWTDVARFAVYGVPAVNYGPGSGAQCHVFGEWISLSSMVRSFELVSEMLSTPLMELGRDP